MFVVEGQGHADLTKCEFGSVNAINLMDSFTFYINAYLKSRSD